MRLLARELEAACGYLERDPLAPEHVAAARAIAEATEAELRSSLADLARVEPSADPADSRGIRSLIVTLLQAQAELAVPHPSAAEAARACDLVECVASLLDWAATNLEIKFLPETREPLA
jgi:hypothetical protein